MISFSKYIAHIIICFCIIYIPCYTQFEEFASQYDILMTIAGKGEEDISGVNLWLDDYEGGNAIDAELSRPHFAMADTAGNIYIADKEAHSIRKVTPDGIITTVAGTNIRGYNGDGLATECQLNFPNGLWVKNDGTLFILDLGNDRIRKVNQNGMLETIIEDPEGISTGRGLWVSQDEELIYYASGIKIKKWDEGEGLHTYVSGFSSLGNLIVDPSGYLVVTDRGGDYVYRIREDNDIQIIAGNGTSSGGGDGFNATDTGLDGVRGIWFFEDQSYLLATHEGSQIWYVDPSGTIHLLLNGHEGDEYHSGDGQHFQTPGYKISEARSVTVDYQGNIIITENDLGFIRKIRKKVNSSILLRNTIPQIYNLHIYPNPFNPQTKIIYSLKKAGNIKISIYNILGNKINSLLNSNQQSGTHEIYWDATDQNGKSVASGIYFLQIETNNSIQTKKLFCLQ